VTGKIRLVNSNYASDRHIKKVSLVIFSEAVPDKKIS
jgi:hypothetical protein